MGIFLPPAADKARGAIALAAMNDLRVVVFSDIASGSYVIIQHYAAQPLRPNQVRIGGFAQLSRAEARATGGVGFSPPVREQTAHNSNQGW